MMPRVAMAALPRFVSPLLGQTNDKNISAIEYHLQLTSFLQHSGLNSYMPMTFGRQYFGITATSEAPATTIR
jgi:hypothetical protein